MQICTEFQEMPGMRLSEAQVRRLSSLSARDCGQALDYLCGSCRLVHDRSGCYLLSSEMREKITLNARDDFRP
jgi:hypothetical protein